MKKIYPYLWASALSLVILSCGNGRGQRAGGKDRPDPIAGVSPSAGTSYHAGDAVAFAVRLREGSAPDSMAAWFEGQKMKMDEGLASFATGPATPLGNRLWRIAVYTGGDSTVRKGEVLMLAAAAPRHYGYKLLHTYPHSTESYTQGLLWHEGYLYESIGQQGKSAVMKVDLQSGRAVERRDMDAHYFGEGLALCGGKLYQLTWQDNTGFVYDLQGLRPAGRFGYTGEGWGLTTDGKLLYMSDGTDKIHVVDPEGFRRLRSITVCTDRGPVEYLNELEWIDGEIWANVYTSSAIVRIDPATGGVKGVVDLSGILPEKEITQQTDVLNGIAWDAARRRVFVTGKNWSKLFEIELTDK